jgi:hypothetical protein
MMKKTQKILLVLTMILALVGASSASAETSSEVLNVPLIGQETGMWCWATVLDMVATFYDVDVEQCAEANHRFGRNDCCTDPTPAACIVGGWPDYDEYGFNSNYTNWNVALTFAQIKTETDAGRPINFSWGWTGGGGHIMVGRGYIDGDTEWVFVRDPWPVDVGESKLIKYIHFVERAGQYEHWSDYYNLAPK